MNVINDSKHIHLTADFDEIAVIVEGLRKAKVAQEVAGRWDIADELATVIEEVMNAEVKID